MIRDHSHRDKRSAFTLIELMVVILIIAILVSLITSAVMKALGKIPEVQTRTEISEMEIALRAFMSDYNLTDPPPSLLILNEATPLVPSLVDNGRSAAFLQQVFGKNLGPTDWNGDGTTGNGTWTLQGQQCLVFYLGGIPSNPNNISTPGALPAGLGFSTNNMKPSYGSCPGETMGKRKGPYFNFVTARLWPPPALNPAPGAFYVYLDPWQAKAGPFYAGQPVPGGAPALGGTPYVYFSSYGINNGYPTNSPLGNVDTDCIGLTFLDALGMPHFPLPYWSFGTGVNGSTSTFTYSNTYQIISAGKDGRYGGGLWSPSSGAQGFGADDQANFSGSLLGAPQS